MKYSSYVTKGDFLCYLKTWCFNSSLFSLYTRNSFTFSASLYHWHFIKVKGCSGTFSICWKCLFIYSVCYSNPLLDIFLSPLFIVKNRNFPRTDKIIWDIVSSPLLFIYSLLRHHLSQYVTERKYSIFHNPIHKLQYWSWAELTAGLWFCTLGFVYQLFKHVRNTLSRCLQMGMTTAMAKVLATQFGVSLLGF